jgi:beta-lactamase class D
MRGHFFCHHRCIFIFAIAYLFISHPALADNNEITKTTATKGIGWTIVLSSLSSEETFIYNESRAARRFSPASTFKILNTLVSLEEKAVPEKEGLMKWDGHQYDIQDWNQNQTLKSAFRHSCVWYFQALARRVGVEKYRDYLHRTAYGELREPFDATSFWLDDSLQISAIEQVEFLRNVYQRAFPFSVSNYETLRQIMLVESGPTFTIWAKSGWVSSVTPQIGWYVGYVETTTDVWFFALNMDILSEEELPMRQQLTKAILQKKGIIK